MAPSPPSSVMFSPLLTITFQYLEHPWVVKVLLLIFLRNIASFLSDVNKQFRNMTQAPQQNGHVWQGMWEKMGQVSREILTSSGLELHSRTTTGS